LTVAILSGIMIQHGTVMNAKKTGEKETRTSELITPKGKYRI